MLIKYNSEEQFTVKRGYINRTRIYLYPAVVLMKSYMPHIKNLKESLLCCSFKEDRIAVYYDRKNTVAIHELIRVLKSNNEYINDYMHNEDVYVIELRPDINYNAFEEGRYSDIYTDTQINLTFSKESLTRKVLSRASEFKQFFVDTLNEWFNTNYSIEKLESRPNGISVEISQYDIPPCMNQEMLNYEKTNVLGRGFIKTKSSKNN